MSSMQSKDTTPMESLSSSPEDATATAEQLRKIADQWRTRIENPTTQALVKAGKLKIDPLILELLELFPRQSTS